MNRRSRPIPTEGIHAYERRSLTPPPTRHSDETLQRRSNTINLFGRKFKLPGNRWMRMTVGVLLILGGCLAILPVFGLWMIPLGLVVLSIDLPRVRRLRRRSEVWTMRRYRRWQQRRHPA